MVMIYKYDVRNKKIAPTRIDFRFARIKFVTHIFLHAVSLKTSEQIKLIYNLMKLINAMTPNIVKQKIDSNRTIKLAARVQS